MTVRNDGFESYSICADDRFSVGLSVRGEGRRPQMHLGLGLCNRPDRVTETGKSIGDVSGL